MYDFLESYFSPSVLEEAEYRVEDAYIKIINDSSDKIFAVVEDINSHEEVFINFKKNGQIKMIDCTCNEDNCYHAAMVLLVREYESKILDYEMINNVNDDDIIDSLSINTLKSFLKEEVKKDPSLLKSLKNYIQYINK